MAYVVACSVVWAGLRQSAGTLDSSVPFALIPLGTAHRDGVGKGAEVAGDSQDSGPKVRVCVRHKDGAEIAWVVEPGKA